MVARPVVNDGFVRRVFGEHIVPCDSLAFLGEVVDVVDRNFPRLLLFPDHCDPVRVVAFKRVHAVGRGELLSGLLRVVRNARSLCGVRVAIQVKGSGGERRTTPDETSARFVAA